MRHEFSLNFLEQQKHRPKRAANQLMVAFYKMPIQPDQLIEHIYIGPQCKVTCNEMKLFLSKYKVKYGSVQGDGIVMR